MSIISCLVVGQMSDLSSGHILLYNFDISWGRRRTEDQVHTCSLSPICKYQSHRDIGPAAEASGAVWKMKNLTILLPLDLWRGGYALTCLHKKVAWENWRENASESPTRKVFAPKSSLLEHGLTSENDGNNFVIIRAHLFLWNLLNYLFFQGCNTLSFNILLLAVFLF